MVWFVWGFGFFKLNRFGWTNEGIDRWIKERYQTLVRTTQSPIANIGPDNAREAITMVQKLNELHLAAITVSVGCANVKKRTVEQALEIIHGACKSSKHPIIVKLSFEQDYVAIARGLEDEDREIILQVTNTGHWSRVFPNRRKPFDIDWAVSGPPIRQFGLEMVRNLRKAGIKAPIIGGGGITRYEDIVAYYEAGADAFYVSTGYHERKVRLWKNQLFKEYRRSQQ